MILARPLTSWSSRIGTTPGGRWATSKNGQRWIPRCASAGASSPSRSSSGSRWGLVSAAQRLLDVSCATTTQPNHPLVAAHGRPRQPAPQTFIHRACRRPQGYCIYHATALVAVADIAIAAPDLMYMPSLIEFSSLPFEVQILVQLSASIHASAHASARAPPGVTDINHGITASQRADVRLDFPGWHTYPRSAVIALAYR